MCDKLLHMNAGLFSTHTMNTNIRKSRLGGNLLILTAWSTLMLLQVWYDWNKRTLDTIFEIWSQFKQVL